MGNGLEKNDIELIELELLDEYLCSLMALQLSHFRRRSLTGNSSTLLSWVRSTAQRHAFALSMIRARTLDKVYSASEISEDIKISRQAVYQMIKDCTPDGWVRIYCEGEELDFEDIKATKGTLKYTAGNELLNVGRNFAKQNKKEADKVFLHLKHNDLMAFQRVKAKLMG